MIQSVWFRNFRALRDLRLDLERLTVFAGANGSGKSSILLGLSSVLRLRSEASESVFIGEDDPELLLSRGAKGDVRIEIATQTRTYKTLFVPRSSQSGNGASTAFRFRCDFSFSEDGGNTWNDSVLARGELPDSMLLRLDPKQLAKLTHTADRVPWLTSSGGGLSAALVDLALHAPGRFARLKEQIRTLFARVEDIRFERVRVLTREEVTTIENHQAKTQEIFRQNWGERLVFDCRDASSVPAQVVGDGVLISLAIFTAVSQADGPCVLLIDNLDHGLHPKTQQAVVELLRQAVESKPGLQVLATTHSPYLLDACKPSEVRLMSLSPRGAVCGSLQAHPEFEEWKNALLPGEFWSHVGETWVADASVTEALS